MDIKNIVDKEHTSLEKWLNNNGYTYEESLRDKLDLLVYSELLQYYIGLAPKEKLLAFMTSNNPIYDSLLIVKEVIDLNNVKSDVISKNTSLIVRKVFGEYRYSLVYEQ